MSSLKSLSCGLVVLLTALCSAQENQKEPNPQEEHTALWRGTYHYPQHIQESVKFNLVMIQQGSKLAGYVREPNSFGKLGEPWLHAVVKGDINKQTGEMTFTKTYDGTAGPSHDVKYSGKTSGTTVEGTWSIGDDGGGQFTLEKTPNTRSGPLSGLWTGSYQYPEGSGQEPVRFNIVMINDRHGITGSIKETNTFGNADEPWLTANVKGTFDAKTGKLTFIKTYDGTAGVEHEVDYSGSLSQDRKKIDGTWALGDGLSGRFTMERLPLDEKTLADLR